MIPALAPLFQGAFVGYREVLTLADDPRRSMPARAFVEPENLERWLACFRPDLLDGDRRALLSLWSKYYFLRLIPPVVAASLVLDWHLPLAFDEIEVVLGEDGLPEAFKLPHAGERWSCSPGDAFERFGGLIENLQVFIQSLAGYRKVAPRVYWSNAGNYLEWFVSTLAALPLPEAQLADGRALLEQRLRPDGSRNPLFQPIRYIEQGASQPAWRQRRTCCIRDQLGLAYCDNCPHRDAPPEEGAQLD